MGDLEKVGGNSSLIFAIDPDGESQELEMDNIYNVLQNINSRHSKIHQGVKYGLSHDFGAITANGGTAEVLIQNPTNNYAHLSTKNFVADTAPAQTKFYEAPTYSSAGSTPDTNTRNLSRSHDDVSNLSITVNPTIDTTGELLYIEGIAGDRSAGGTANLDYIEYILKPDTDYLMRFNNLSTADTQICVFNAVWYE